MKRFTMALAASLLLAPMTAQAQAAVTHLNISNTTNRIAAGMSPYNGSGGQFGATITIPSYLLAPKSNVLVYCIDFDRQFSPGTTYTNYKAYTFTQFAALNFQGVTVGDLNAIVDNAIDINTFGAGAASNAAQNETWDIFRNTTTVASTSDHSAEWVVLFNADKRGVGNQTFVAKLPGGSIQVPEPSTFVLTSAGLLAVAFVRRRRNTV